jgi:hypothetical protein
MAAPTDYQDGNTTLLDEPALDGASSSGPSLEIDVRTSLGALPCPSLH